MKPTVGSMLMLVLMLLTASDAHAGLVLAVDIGVVDAAGFNSLTPNEVATGFSDLSATPNFHASGNEDFRSIFPSQPQLSGTIGGVVVTIATAPASNGLTYFDSVAEMPDVGDISGDLTEDGVRGFDGGGPAITVTLSGIAAGIYELTTFHHDSLAATGNSNSFDVDVDGGNGFIEIADSILASSSSTPGSITTVVGTFVATGGDIVFRIDADSASLPVTMNGFSLSAVPEPSALGFFMISGFACTRSRRRSPIQRSR